MYRILSWCEKMYDDDIKTNKAIGEHGGTAIIKQSNDSNSLNILTHCNTGSLATAGYGTALGVVRNLSNKKRIG